MNRLLPFFLLLLSSLITLGQNTNLSGVLSMDVTPITGVDPTSGTLTVGNTAPFSTGDRVLIIQMQGASMTTTPSSSYGDLIALNGAGSYEINVVCDVRTSDSEVILDNQLANTYSSTPSTAGLQLIRIPQYDDVTVTSTLSAPAWDGSTGGVLAFEAAGTVTLLDDIDMTGNGFRGGAVIDDGNSTCFPPFFDPQFPAWSYSNPTNGASKGEGISTGAPGQEYGMGRRTNGGGGEMNITQVEGGAPIMEMVAKEASNPMETVMGIILESVELT